MIGIIKGYSIDIETFGKEIDEDYLIDIIEHALDVEGFKLMGLAWQANWKDWHDYERNIQC